MGNGGVQWGWWVMQGWGGKCKGVVGVGSCMSGVGWVMQGWGGSCRGGLGGVLCVM